MLTIDATRARAGLYKLLEQVAQTREPVHITGPGSAAALICEDDWRSIQETLYLLSIPDMRESIVEGMNAPVEECIEEPGW